MWNLPVQSTRFNSVDMRFRVIRQLTVPREILGRLLQSSYHQNNHCYIDVIHSADIQLTREVLLSITLFSGRYFEKETCTLSC